MPLLEELRERRPSADLGSSKRSTQSHPATVDKIGDDRDDFVIGQGGLTYGLD